MKPRDRVLETLAAHEPHRIERPPIRMMAQAVDRHDSGMLKAPGDLRFEQKPRARLAITGVPLLDLLERHLAVQLFVHRHRNDTQAALRVWAQNAKPTARHCRTAQVGGRGRDIPPNGSEAQQTGLEVRIGHLSERVAHRA